MFVIDNLICVLTIVRIYNFSKILYGEENKLLPYYNINKTKKLLLNINYYEFPLMFTREKL
ncbi:hypothetical protein SPE_1168 [Spiroplasma eriocheiris CCTCC M 207170]|nr:hypothetical protein SPE_1168 [Spiroplasma eriocheiris CCTCC M 207170]